MHDVIKVLNQSILKIYPISLLYMLITVISKLSLATVV